ncbi:DUF1499 domain-containing protein [Devosia sp. FKR38]|uniref:DUF1499 domain-containing protein n=1 Tax=Devosia sp. FKR38 TaxID=2562312 RepID=UPI00148566B7|nr:DUF1499 domain-containing protein [Devosia sp. FKR38]
MPLVVLSVLLHRFGLVSGDRFLVIIGLGGVVALLAVTVSLMALARLWQTGDRGWNRALFGLILGLVCLAPYLWYGQLALHYPPVTDIATTQRDALPLIFEAGTADMPAPRLLTAEQIASTFPNVVSRTYRLSQTQIFEIVSQLVEDNGWTMRRSTPPGGSGQPGRINAQTMTWPGWREEIVLAVTGNDDSATVDMRSASLNAPHDFGSNGLRIESFLRALDEAVTTALRDAAGTAPPAADDVEDEAIPPVTTEGDAAAT